MIERRRKILLGSDQRLEISLLIDCKTKDERDSLQSGCRGDASGIIFERATAGCVPARMALCEFSI